MLANRFLLRAAVLVAVGPIDVVSAYDSDGDGVDDHLDVCCATPTGKSVDEQGRPIGDLDGDCDVDLVDFAMLEDNFTGQLPPCPPCGTSADCLEGHYCARTIGNCLNEGACNVRPSDCPAIVEPVCGCDGMSYASVCIAALAGESVDYDGECQPSGCQSYNDCLGGDYCAKATGECDGFGTCELLPSQCIPISDPVCACDGVTYMNECFAIYSGETVDYTGQCLPPTCQLNTECAEDSYCAKSDGDCQGTGLCEQRPGGCIPTGNTVCGCDDVTYDDSCAAAMAGVNVADAESCPE
jgi:hypothetical protein